MAKIKLTKSAVDAAQPQAQTIELRDTLAPGFLCKMTPAGRTLFMLTSSATRTGASCSGSSTRSRPKGWRTTSSLWRSACNSSSPAGALSCRDNSGA